MCERYARKPDMHNQGQRRKEVKKIMKKKLLALIMTACMVTTMFTACGKADSPAASETEG